MHKHYGEYMLCTTITVNNISYPLCKKGIRHGVWLNADTRPYPFFTKRVKNLLISYGHDFSYECKKYQPKSLLVTFCHLYFYIYTILADYNAQIVFQTQKNIF